jgi:hypothetical protein
MLTTALTIVLCWTIVIGTLCILLHIAYTLFMQHNADTEKEEQ